MRGLGVLVCAVTLVAAACGGTIDGGETPGVTLSPVTTSPITLAPVTTSPVVTRPDRTAAPTTTPVTTTPATTTPVTTTPAAAITVDPSLVAGSARTDTFGIDQVWVPAGVFMMGSDDTSGFDVPSWANAAWASEQPAHEVELTRGYWIDRHEVTNEAFDAFVAAGGYDEPAHWSEEGLVWLARQDPLSLPAACESSEADHPRACVTWHEAEAYAAWRGGRLPTEAEWEFAARGPDSFVFPWGDVWDTTLANIEDSTGTTAVGSYPRGASWVGAVDMAGNVMEWVGDWWSFTYYEERVRVDPHGPESGSKKVEKGGWWGKVPFVGRSAYRHFEDPPTYQDEHIGFRVVAGS